MSSNIVVIEPYTSEWPERFARERAHLASILPVDAVVEHIGSTAVEALAAKPIVDILIGVDTLATANECIALLQSNGFEYISKYEVVFPERRFFHKDASDGVRLFNVHMVVIGSTFWRNHLYFRDRLRADADLSKRYEQLKVDLAERYRSDRESYTDAKTDFIMSVVDEQKQAARETTSATAHEFLERGDNTGWFEQVYEQASGDLTRIPWADNAANPYLVGWLDSHFRNGEGVRALVVGCGLGDDAEELSRRGYKVTAFDISKTAIAWAKKRFRESRVTYEVADLFEISNRRAGSFDFVFESYTVQALPRDVRSKAIDAVTNFVAKNGELLVVARAWRGEGLENGPPWPITDEEMKHFESKLALRTKEEFTEADNNTRRIRCLYTKD